MKEEPTGAPEKYEAFTLPEGATPLAEPVMAKFQEWAKAQNLPQGKAQEVINLYAANQQAQVETFQAEREKFFKGIGGMPDQWKANAQKDPELAGEDGRQFDKNLAVAKAALDKFGTPQLQKFLAATQADQHAEILRAFYRVGQAISQDSFVPGRPAGGRKSDAEVFYPPKS